MLGKHKVALSRDKLLFAEVLFNKRYNRLAIALLHCYTAASLCTVYWPRNHILTISFVPVLICANLKLGSGFELCLLGQDDPLIAEYCQRIGWKAVSTIILSVSTAGSRWV